MMACAAMMLALHAAASLCDGVRLALPELLHALTCCALWPPLTCGRKQVFQEDSPPILPRAVRRLQYSRIAEGDDGEDEDEDEE